MASPVAKAVRFSRREPVYAMVIVGLLSLLRLFRLRPRVTGAHNLPAEGGYVLAISHFSYIDFAVAGFVVWDESGRPMRFLAIRAAFDHWLSGPVMRRAKHIPVDRGAGANAYAAAVEAVQSGEIIGIFPEAKVSMPMELLPFKKGAVRLAAQAGVPVVPVTVWGSQRVLTRGRRARIREAWRAPISVVVGEPITISPDDDIPAANEQLRAVMQTQLRAQQATFPLDGTGKWWQPHRLGGAAPLPAPQPLAPNQ